MARPQKKAKAKNTKEIELYLRVLGYTMDDGTWAAHCLETDLVGYGRTFAVALKDLIELTEIQLSFAVFKDQPALLDNPAPTEIIEIYNRLMREYLQSSTKKLSKIDPKRRATSIRLPDKPSRPDLAFAQA